MVLKLVDGHQLLKSNNKIGKYIQKYYKDLYTSDQVVNNNDNARHLANLDDFCERKKYT